MGNKIVMVCTGILLMVFHNCSLVMAIDQPIVKIEPSNIDLGTHVIGTEISVIAKIVNNGSSIVTIEKIKTSCGCSKAEPEAWKIQPGSSVKLEITVDSINREGDFSQVVWIIVDDTQNPVHKINITGKFFAPDYHLVASPNIIDLGTSKIDDKISQVVQITRHGKVPLGPIRVSSSAKWCNVDIDDRRTTKEKLYLVFTADIPKGMTEISEEIRVQGSDPNDFVRIPVRGIVLPPIWVFPEMVLVTPNKSEYQLLIKTHTLSMPKLVCHDFKGNGLKIKSFKANPERIVINVDREKSHKGFAKGKLLLQYEGKTEPIKIIFVSAPSTPIPKTGPKKPTVDKLKYP